MTRSQKARCSVAIVLLLGGLEGCFMVPSSSTPVGSVEHNATFEPGFGSNAFELARWTCAESTPTEDAPMAVPGVVLVLLKHPQRGILLHNVTDDLVMEPAETIPGGGTRFVSQVPAQGNRYIVPPDYQDPVDREWSLVLGSSVTRAKQSCQPGPLVRFL